MPPKGKKAPEPKVSRKQKMALEKDKKEAQKVMEKYMPTIQICIVCIFVCFLGTIVLGATGVIHAPSSRV